MKLVQEIQKYCLFSMFFTPAFANDHLIPCVDSHTLQQYAEKIDTAQFVNNQYLVYTSTSAYQVDNLWWYISVGGINAKTADEAIQKGKEMVKETNIQNNTYAIKQGNDYICKYENGYIQSTGKNL